TWMAGRHALRVCRDVVPTGSERSEEMVRLINRGIELLQGPADLRLDWNVSKRWHAMRHRYLCRGYALRWFIGHTSNTSSEISSADLVAAYASIQDALVLSRGPGLERQHVA